MVVHLQYLVFLQEGKTNTDKASMIIRYFFIFNYFSLQKYTFLRYVVKTRKNKYYCKEIMLVKNKESNI